MWQASEESIAKSHGWLAYLKRGHEIIHELTALSPKKLADLKISAYRGEQVAFLGSTAPSGGTNDLVTESGFYLRVVNPAGKDLRPQAVGWMAMVFGKIEQVLPQNKIIVIEVDENDWVVGETI
jgi:hypothetical protein